jgi:hypothetical protein
MLIRGAGVPAFLLIFFALLSSTPIAKAEYRLRLSEIDETGAQRALASWTCLSALRDECSQQVQMSLGGKIQLVEVTFIVEDSRAVDLNLIANNNVLQAFRKDPLFVSKSDGIVGGAYELLMTQRKVKENATVRDLTFRPPYDLFTTIGLIVEHVTASTSK